MAGPRLSVAVGVAWSLTLCPAAVADGPPAGVEIRSEDGKVLIAANQIRSYEWATHTLTLAPKAREELARRLLKDRVVSGIPFAVAVGGNVVYRGTFTTVASSRSFATPVIVVDAQAVDAKLGADQLRIQLGYPTTGFFKGEDPRADRRVRTALRAAGRLTEAESEHSKWVAVSLREMQTIKPGMTREDLLKVFREEEGGLSNRSRQRFAYRDCPYIKVDVTFEAVGDPADKLTKSPNDKIARITAPFLEWPIID